MQCFPNGRGPSSLRKEAGNYCGADLLASVVMLVAHMRTIWDKYCMSFLDPSIKGRLQRVRRIWLLLASVRRRVRIIMIQLQILPADYLHSMLMLEMS